MVIQSSRVVIRLPQLSLQCLGSRRTGLGFLNVQRVVALHDTFDSRKPIGVALNDSFLSSIIRRTYATTTKPVSRPKAHTGRTTTAARKAPTTSKTKAAKKPAVKKTAPKAIPKDGPEAVPKTKPKARTTAKPTAKPRIKPKPKSAKKAKAKPKSKRKTLTQVEKDEKLHKDLKAAALKPPHGTPATAWTVFNAEAVKSNGVGGGFAQAIRESAAQFKNLSPERLEHYNHVANQNKAANAMAYRQWIESHTPTVIHEANLARASLKRRKVKGYTSKLQDHRQVRGRRNTFAYFSKDRHATGDLKGLKIAEAARLCSREWKGLSASERKPYEDAAAADMVRYVQEKKTVYNKDVKQKATAAPAA